MVHIHFKFKERLRHYTVVTDWELQLLLFQFWHPETKII